MGWYFCENHGGHKLEVDKALLILNNSKFPNGRDLNFNSTDIIPLGWSPLGFFYYLTSQNYSTIYATNYSLESFNINSGLTISLFSFEVGSELDSYGNCRNLISFKEKWEELVLAKNIVPISQLSMRYSQVSCTPFYINGVKVSVTNDDCTGREKVCRGSVHYQTDEDGGSSSEALREFILKKYPVPWRELIYLKVWLLMVTFITH